VLIAQKDIIQFFKTYWLFLKHF